MVLVYQRAVGLTTMKITHVQPSINRLTPRDAYLRKRCAYRYQIILLDPLTLTNLKLFVFIADIHFLLPKIPLLPCLTKYSVNNSRPWTFLL